MERIGLVGLPNAGKSSALQRADGRGGGGRAHPFSTTETTVGVAQVPDMRLEALAEMSKSRKWCTPAVELVDIAGLVAGASTGEGLGNRFLGGIREVDAICLVLRAFEDRTCRAIPTPWPPSQVLELELVLADLATVESQLDKRRKAARVDKSLAAEVAALEAADDALPGRHAAYRLEPVGDERAALRPLFLLTNKPVLAVVNLGEDESADPTSRS